MNTDTQSPQTLTSLEDAKLVEDLDGYYEPTNMNTCKLPRLSSLSLDVGHVGIALMLVTQRPDFLFTQVKHLDLRLPDTVHRQYLLLNLRDSVLPILRRSATSLTSLHTIDITYSVTLKWI